MAKRSLEGMRGRYLHEQASSQMAGRRLGLLRQDIGEGRIGRGIVIDASGLSASDDVRRSRRSGAEIRFVFIDTEPVISDIYLVFSLKLASDQISH